MKTNVLPYRAAVLALALVVNMFCNPEARALYTPPSNPFISPGVVPVTLNITSGTLAEVQQALDTARGANPTNFIVLNLSGTYTVSSTPLTLSSMDILYLNGAIQAASASATAPALIVVNPGQTRVAIMGAGGGGTLEGLGANLHGVRVNGSSRIALDGLTVRNTGREGLYLEGTGKAVWDAQFSVTRCDVSGSGASGIRLTNVNQAVAVDNYCHNNATVGIDLDADNTSVAGNACDANTVSGIRVSGTLNTLYGNLCDGNPTGIHFSGTSTNGVALMNTNRNSTTAGVAVAGAWNTVFDNSFSGNATDLTSGGANNNIIPALGALNGTGNRYFYPPTARNPHTDNLIMNGKGRFDLVIASNTTMATVQQQYNAAKAAHPNDIVVLHLTGSTITLGAASLILSNNTCVLLGPATQIVTDGGTTATRAINAASGASYISVSGGVIDGGGRTMAGIDFNNTSMTLIDGVTLRNFGAKATRTTGTDAIHLNSGGNPQIVRGCTIDNSGARGIWTQLSSGRFIIADNEVSNCNMDGIDCDSFTSSSVVANNLCHDNLRYGVFVEEGAQKNTVINNYLPRNNMGINIYANAAGPTSFNGFFCNVVESNARGLRNGALSGFESSHNYFFNNVVLTNSQYGICSQNVGTENYYSENVLSGNASNTWTSTTVFFNPSQGGISNTVVAAPTFTPVAGAYTGAQSVTISTTTSGASIRYTTDGSTPSSTVGTLYSAPVNISVTTTLKAIAYKAGIADSPVTTGVYTITTCTPPTITGNPVNATTCAGSTAGFSVTAIGDGLTYQWQLSAGGGAFGNISGATSPSYTTPATVTGDNGNQYRCVVNGTCGTATSSAATLTVNARPTSVASGTATICAGGSTTVQAALTGTGPWNVTWSDGNVQNGVAASPATRSVSPGSTTTYTVTALTDASCTAQAGDRTGSAVVTVNTAPSITAQPQSQTVTAGANVSFSVTATGTAPLTYQWRKGGANLGGATSSTYNLTAVTTNDAGSYDVVVNNACGSATSAAATLTVNVSSLPAPWLTADIGAVGIVGSATHSAGTYTITGSGTGITGTADQFRYVYQTLSGDGSITARLTSQSGTTTASLAGVMIRETTATGSRFAGVWHCGSGSKNMRAVRRTSTGGSTTSTSATSQTPPNCWVRITRTGSSFVMARSTNGTSWTTINTSSITMASEITVGILVTSGSNSVLDTDAFDSVTVIP